MALFSAAQTLAILDRVDPCLSAIDAGLTIAVQPLVTMFASGFAAGISQKVNGKYLLMPGLLALALGSGYIDWAAHASSGRWDFLPGLILSGLGMGFIWIAPQDARAAQPTADHLVVSRLGDLAQILL